MVPKRHQEWMKLNTNKSKSFQRDQVTTIFFKMVEIDDTIDYTVKIGMNNDDCGAQASESIDILIAQKAGRISSSSAIHHDLDAMGKLEKWKLEIINASKYTPGTIKSGQTVYFLNKG
jgi:hypothetical protein